MSAELAVLTRLLSGRGDGRRVGRRALSRADTPKNRTFITKVRATVKKYENTGVRIEDDYIITEKGTERITTAPREIVEIEALMKQRGRIQP